MQFPKDFVWGAATASYQIEGGAFEDGRQPSVWDAFSHEKGKVKHGGTGDVACDHYHRYKEDIQILKTLGIKHYRFSTAWTRVLSYESSYGGGGVKGTVNQKGLDFYDRLIDELLKNDIEPWLTLFHWDLPQELERKGGWRNRDIMYWAADYTELMVKRYGDRIKNIFTLNEMPCILAGYYGWMAPGLVLSQKEILNAVHNILLTHGNMVQAIRANAPDSKIGFAHCGNAMYPATDSAKDIAAFKKAASVFESSPSDYAPQEGSGIFSSDCLTYWCDPIHLGHYPEKAFDVFKDEMPQIKDGDMKLISSPIDFHAQNTYQGCCIAASSAEGKDDGGFHVIPQPQGVPRTDAKWPITPRSMHYFNNFICERYGKPLYISENGMSGADIVSPDGKVHDQLRIDFTQSYLHELALAIQDGADIRGYFHWSLLDNFEWARGYEERFGLVHVDYATQKRTIKDSAFWYKSVIENNGKDI